MNRHIESAKTYIAARKETTIGIAVIAGGIILISLVALFIYTSTPKIVYQPTNACELLSTSKAQGILGSGALKSGAKDAVVSGNTATSSCGYTDGTSDTETMVVAAITARSGINDQGVQQNKTEFESGKPARGIEHVSGVGDSAYFNQTRGQLNILAGRNWIIVSYGVGSAPETNTVDKAVELAHVILR